MSNILSPKTRAGLSEELADRLEKTTGIKAIVWATGRRHVLKKLLREFFYSQKFLERIHKAGGEA